MNERSPDGRRALRARLEAAEGQIRATSDILRVLASSSPVRGEVLDAIADNARRLLRADVAQLHLANGDLVPLRAWSGLTPEFIEASGRHPPRRDRATLVGRVTLDRTPQQIRDVLADPDYAQFELQRLGGYRTIAGAPMLIDDEVVGSITVWRTEVAPFDEAELALLLSFAAQAALALRHTDLYAALESRTEQLAHSVDQLKALAQIGEAISSSLDPDEVLTMIVTQAVQLTGTDGGSIMEYDDEARAFRVLAAYGTEPDVVETLRRATLDIDRTWVGLAARTRELHQIRDLDDVDLDPHLKILHDAGWRSLVVAPLVRPDRVVGALVVRRKVPGDFTADACELLETFASQSAIALMNARLYRELERQSLALAQASRHKSEFLASMSHELRTPLNAVIGFSDVLLDRIFGELNERQEDYLGDIRSAGRHLLALLNDILDLSKIEAGRMELDLAAFDLEPVLDASIALVRERAAQHGIELSLDCDPDLGAVEGDELRIKQVLLNLLSNAVKFTPDGGSIVVTARPSGADVAVSVRDTGIGIDAADQEQIFDSFGQSGGSASKAEGTGLGLTLSRRIVRLHGGELTVRSVLGGGSTFTFTLPRRRETPADGPGNANGETVVVIEDDPRSAELVRVHLEAAGLRVVTAPTGEEGLILVRTTRPAAIVLDVRLPGIDGWDVLADLKTDPDTAPIPVVVVTVAPERGHAFALGAADYLAKPVRGDHLLSALHRALETHAAPAAGASPTAAGTAVPLSVVVIDDDPMALSLVRATLEPRGWLVHTCDGGVGAADMVREVRPSVVLVDLMMPLVDGFQVIDDLSRLPGGEHPPVVVLTAKALTPTDRRRLEGRIAWVSEKGGLDLEDLARRLAALAARSGSGGPA
jgi:signal transduction histidine kinase/DNA-binding response OmpR family regulator